jgi:hypothetical protein
MAEIKVKYGTATGITITLASLASTVGLTAGRQSDIISNETDLFDDVLISGQITTGTSPAADTFIEIWVWGTQAGGGLPTAGAGTADANFDPTDEKELMARLEVIPIDTTSDRAYVFGPKSLLSAMGLMPARWGIFVVHNTNVALNATGTNHDLDYTGLTYTSV